MQQRLSLVSYCCKALHFRYLLGSWINLWKQTSVNIKCQGWQNCWPFSWNNFKWIHRARYISKLTRAFVCSTAFYILIKSVLRLFIFQTVSNTAKFCGKGQFPYCYGNYAFSQNVHTRKLVKLRYFTQCDKFPHFRRQKRDGEAFSAKVNCLVIFPY